MVAVLAFNLSLYRSGHQNDFQNNGWPISLLYSLAKRTYFPLKMYKQNFLLAGWNATAVMGDGNRHTGTRGGSVMQQDGTW